MIIDDAISASDAERKRSLVRDVRMTLTTPDNWCQWASARNQYGLEVDDINGPDATKFCLAGAAQRVRADDGAPVLLAHALGFESASQMIRWNDAADRTFDQIVDRLVSAEGRLANV